MELLSGVLCFLSIISALYQIKDKVDNKDEKKQLADFLNRIGILLKEVSDDLEQNKYPYDKCTIMFEFMMNMKTVLKNKLDIKQIENLQNLIEESYRVEKLLGELNSLSTEERNHNINILKSASGSFIAISELIRLEK